MANWLQHNARLAWDRLQKGLFGIDWGAGPDPSGYQWSQDWVRGLEMMRTGSEVARPYEQVGPYQRVVSVISRDAAAVPWEMFAMDSEQEPGDDPIPNHQVLQLWKRPNDYMLGNQLFIGSYISKMVFGEWIWYYPDLTIGRRDGLRATQASSGEIMLLNPRAIRIEVNDAGEVEYWHRDAKTGVETQLDSDRITMSKRYNPYNPLRGLPLSTAIMADLAGYYAAAEWNKRFFGDQNGVPTLVFKPGEKSQADQNKRDDFARRWNQKHAGRRGIGVMPGGWDVVDLGISQRDMDFNELRQFGRDEFLAAGGVPPLVAGYLTRSVTYNASEQKEVYWESTITNFITEEQAVLNEDFLPKVGVTDRVFPNWDLVKALLENLNEKTTVAKEWFAMGLSKQVINERLDMGWDPDQIEDYEQGYLGFALAPVDLLSEPRTPAGPAGDPDDMTEEQEEKAEKFFRTVNRKRRERKALSDGGREQRRTMVWKGIIVRTRDIELRLDTVIRKHMNAIRREALEYVDGLKGWLDRQRLTSVGKFNREVVLKQDGPDFFDVEAFKRLLQELTAPIHRQAVTRGGESVIADIGIGINFNLQDPRVAAKLAELSHKITRIDDTIELALRESLVIGLGEGESPQQLAARVRDVMDASVSRSMTIARTETGFAFNTGRNEGMKQAGITRHEWLTARDPKVRETHVAEDGHVTDVGEPFPITKLLYPQDPSGPPGEIINCRCVAIPVLEGET